MAPSADPQRRSLSASLALGLLFIQGDVPPLATGHLLRGHNHHSHDNLHHHHDHDHGHEDHSHHDHNHRRTNGLESEFNSHAGHADVFDSCFITCYSDMVDRYGAEFAEQLKYDGFQFEECEDDDDDSTATDNNYDDTQQQYANSTSTQQRALHRVLGATNQLNRLWTVPAYRSTTVSGKLNIPYSIKATTHFSNSTLQTIQAAMAHIEEATGVINFIPRENETEYIYFSYEDYYSHICAANLGKQTLRRTNLYLGWCREERHLGNIIHELLHALGFWHEHSRPDRDEHVIINWANLKQNALNNFKKSTMVNSLGSPYDYSSIMHYPQVAFSTNNQATILPAKELQKWETMGQRAQLSPHDIEQLRLLYQCASGPRIGADINVTNLCSEDCPCWEHAMGDCSYDIECMGDLICAPRPNPLPSRNAVDLLPHFTKVIGRINCNDHCHPGCCYYSNSVIKCPVTCDAIPPEKALPSVLPTNMCVKEYNAGSGARSGGEVGGSSATGATTTPAAATTTTATATTTTAATTTTTTTTRSQWYVKWELDRCVQYCNGPAPCGGIEISDTAALYPSVESCCSNSQLYYKTFEECSQGSTELSPTTPIPSEAPSMNPTEETTTTEPTSLPSSTPSVSSSDKPTSLPSETPTVKSTTALPSQNPTHGPTKSPEAAATTTTTSTATTTTKLPEAATAVTTTTTAAAATTTTTTTSASTATTSAAEVQAPSGDWFIDWDIDKCVRDCIGGPPCRNRRKEWWETGHATVQGCCANMSYISFNECSYAPVIESRMGTQASVAADTRWYPDGTECKNDGNAPDWQHNRHNSHSSCCNGHFNWDYNNCMGITPAATHKWYVNWSVGKCVKDCATNEGSSCGGLMSDSWIRKHESGEACCGAHMAYATIPECKYEG